ncbi:unnamed protein product [Ectocarpus sp. 12 AP-2014]
MFDMLASKIGEAQAFADGLVNLDVINMDRLLEEQEREERSKEESLRLLRSSEETTDASSSQDSSGTSTTAPTAGRSEREANSLGSVGTLGDVEIPQLRPGENAKLRSHPSPRGSASEHSSFGDRFASMEDGGGNFEDEFDPILASIRKPQPPPASATAAASSMSPRGRLAAATAAAPPSGGERGRDANDTGRPSTGSSLAAGFLSMLPGDMRAKAGEVMAQSSARISESANAFRSALGPGGAAQSATDKSKRRQSDQTCRGVDGGDHELEEGRGGEDDVRLMNVNEVLSEEERQQLASFAGGAGAGRFCGWRRLRKYIPVFVGIGLLGLLYLWRWTTLLVGKDTANEVKVLGSERM